MRFDSDSTDQRNCLTLWPFPGRWVGHRSALIKANVEGLEISMQAFVNDLTYALRQLRKTPGLSLLAVLTLALGVGANTAIFNVIESVLLRPLPYAGSDRLLYIGPADQPSFGSSSWLNYRDIRDQSQQLKAVAGYSEDVSVIEDQGGSQSVVAP